MFQASPNLSSTTPKCAPHGACANGMVTLPSRVSFSMLCSPSSQDVDELHAALEFDSGERFTADEISRELEC